MTDTTGKAEQEERFIRENAATWKELERSVRFFSRRMGRLRNALRNALGGSAPTKEDVDRLIVLYNKTANHLAYCRTNFGNTETAEYLNRLLGRAHPLIYTRKVFRIRDVFRGIAVGIPRLFRARIAFFLVAMAVFLVPMLVSYLYTVHDLRNAFAFVDPSTVDSVRPEGRYDPFSPDMSLAESIFIGQNNVRVTLLAFAGGATLGIYTVYILIQNGLLLGALAGVYHHAGADVFFWSLILPHGVTELFAIMLSGAAGLMVAYACIHPGALSRKNALVMRGAEACRLMGAVVLLLIVSAGIEGYFTPLALSYAVKYAFSLMMLLLLVLYLTLPGRKRISRPYCILHDNPV